MRAGAVFVLVAVVAAGCAGRGSDEPAAFEDLAPQDGKGLIRGIVADPTVRPVVGAVVEAMPGGLRATTDAEGAFFFTDLAEGTYFLTATAEGHRPIQTSVAVDPAIRRPPIIRITLEPLPEPDPFVVAMSWEAFMDLSASTLENRLVAGGYTGQGFFIRHHDFRAGPSWLQSELAWDPEHPLADTMRIEAELAAGGSYGAETHAVGTSPLLHVFADEIKAVTNGIRYTLWVDDSTTLPAGLTLQQPLSMYTHVFYHFVPDEGWRFSRDGPPVPP